MNRRVVHECSCQVAIPRILCLSSPEDWLFPADDMSEKGALGHCLLVTLADVQQRFSDKLQNVQQKCKQAGEGCSCQLGCGYQNTNSRHPNCHTHFNTPSSMCIILQQAAQLLTATNFKPVTRIATLTFHATSSPMLG